MPSNGKGYLSVRCIRGVRKVRPSKQTRWSTIELNLRQLFISDWNSYTSSTHPDVFVALSDIPFTPPPHSQKRTNKSLERSTQWLLDILTPVPHNPEDRPNLLVHLAGGINPSARQAFSQALTETLFGPEADQAKPLRNLDDAITGYTFDLVPLRKALKYDMEADHTLVHLIQTSLQPLPFGKLRIANSVRGPQDVLRLISNTGIDLFDSQWAVDLATFGVALDFTFPIHTLPTGPPPAMTRDNGKTDIGHNLYDGKYAGDFNRLSTLFLDGQSNSSIPVLTPADDTCTERRWCPCVACSPMSPRIQLKHSKADEHTPDPSASPEFQPAYTRAYIHHLLHTHEMSAHALLTTHNLAVVDRFFADIRVTLAKDGIDKFREGVQRFKDWYDNDEVTDGVTQDSDKVELVGGTMGREAKSNWATVDKARGKGRIAREKEKSGVAALEEAEVV